MTDSNDLIEQHILRYESHLNHIDEMLHQAGKHVAAGTAPPEAEAELDELKEEREKLAGHLSEMKRKGPEEWERETLERAGPIGIWDAVAQRLEKLVEHLD
ncbi:MAG: hypothetical protein WB783_09640 [Arenicellales bacterium]